MALKKDVIFLKIKTKLKKAPELTFTGTFSLCVSSYFWFRFSGSWVLASVPALLFAPGRGSFALCPYYNWYTLSIVPPSSPRGLLSLWCLWFLARPETRRNEKFL